MKYCCPCVDQNLRETGCTAGSIAPHVELLALLGVWLIAPWTCSLAPWTWSPAPWAHHCSNFFQSRRHRQDDLYLRDLFGLFCHCHWGSKKMEVLLCCPSVDQNLRETGCTASHSRQYKLKSTTVVDPSWDNLKLFGGMGLTTRIERVIWDTTFSEKIKTGTLSHISANENCEVKSLPILFWIYIHITS